jgi:hypothetical protein
MAWCIWKKESCGRINAIPSSGFIPYKLGLAEAETVELDYNLNHIVPDNEKNKL